MVMASAPGPPDLTDGIGGLESAVGFEPTTCCLQDTSDDESGATLRPGAPSTSDGGGSGGKTLTRRTTVPHLCNLGARRLNLTFSSGYIRAKGRGQRLALV
jgi:hypothetical protein